MTNKIFLKCAKFTGLPNWSVLNLLEIEFIVPTPPVGGGTIYLNEFFLFIQFWPIDISILKRGEW